MPTSDALTTVESLKQVCREFRDARDWKRFHNPKDLALALSCEAAELLELFRFKDVPDVDVELAQEGPRQALSEEMADVLYWLLMMSDHTGIDLTDALRRKMQINDRNYPVERARGRNVKYTVLEAESNG